MPVDVAALAHVVAIGFEEVEDVECVAYRFSVEEDVTGEVGDGLVDGFGKGDGESPAVDADDVVALFADQEASTIVFLLEAVLGVGQEARHFPFLDRVEELAVDAGGDVFSSGGFLSFILEEIDPT